MSCSCWWDWILGLMTLQLQGAQTLMKHPKYNGSPQWFPNPLPTATDRSVCGDFCSHTSGLHIMQRAANTPRFPSCVDDCWLMNRRVLRNALMFVDLVTSSCVKVVTDINQPQCVYGMDSSTTTSSFSCCLTFTNRVITPSTDLNSEWWLGLFSRGNFTVVYKHTRLKLCKESCDASSVCTPVTSVEQARLCELLTGVFLSINKKKEKNFKFRYKLLATAHQSLWTRTNLFYSVAEFHFFPANLNMK